MKYKHLSQSKQKDLKIEQINEAIKHLKKLRKLIKMEVLQPIYGILVGDPVVAGSRADMDAWRSAPLTRNTGANNE